MNKLTKGWLFLAISLFVFGSFFSCNDPARNNGVGVENGGKETYEVRFAISREDQGNITATVDGASISNGAKVEKGKKITFTVKLNDPNAYEVYSWEEATTGSELTKATLIVEKNTSVLAIIKGKDEKAPTIKSLRIYGKNVDVDELDDANIEVENFVKTLTSYDIVATFSLHGVLQEFPLTADKANLDVGANIVTVTLAPLVGQYIGWKGKVKITRKGAEQAKTLDSDVTLEALEVALVGVKDGRANIEAFNAVNGFNASSSGYYEIEDAKTAYVALKMKKAKPASGDFSIELTNKTAYEAPVVFERNTTGDQSYFGEKKIALSQGYNVLEVKVSNSDKSKTGVYTLVVKYNGGPNPLTIPLAQRKTLPGVYCPAQRKPLEGESPDLIWLMAIAGFCHNCDDALKVAGNKDNLANKYRGRGLRVVIVDKDGTPPSCDEKWKAAGAGFPLYNNRDNSLERFYKGTSGYPKNIAIKNGVGDVMPPAAESNIKHYFGF